MVAFILLGLLVFLLHFYLQFRGSGAIPVCSELLPASGKNNSYLPANVLDSATIFIQEKVSSVFSPRGNSRGIIWFVDIICSLLFNRFPRAWDTSVYQADSA